MATYSSKQEKRQSWGNSVPVLVSVLLIGVFVIFAPLNASFYSSLGSILGNLDSAENVYTNAEPSFAVDAEYWEGNCTHGWTSDATCDGINLRVQSCSLSAASPYCASYENYLQEFFNQ